jgi:hypothetical protein
VHWVLLGARQLLITYTLPLAHASSRHTLYLSLQGIHHLSVIHGPCQQSQHNGISRFLNQGSFWPTWVKQVHLLDRKSGYRMCRRCHCNQCIGHSLGLGSCSLHSTLHFTTAVLLPVVLLQWLPCACCAVQGKCSMSCCCFVCTVCIALLAASTSKGRTTTYVLPLVPEALA